MDIGLLLLILLYALNIISIFSLLFIERKEASVTLGWLMIFIFVPVLGFVLYYFFGSTYKLRMFTKKYNPESIEKSYFYMLNDYIREIISGKVKFDMKRSQEYKNMIVMNVNNSMSYYSENNDVKMLLNGKEYFDSIVDDIKNAKESINLSYFIFDPHSKIGASLIDLLVMKIKEGVEVRIIYDRFGRAISKRKYFKKILDAGGMVYAYLPSLIKSIVQINYRMHRKMLIIDGKIAYTGGFNIGDEYLNENLKLKPWRDTAVRIVGEAVEAIQFRFVCDWIFLDKQASKRKKIDNEDAVKENREIFFKSVGAKEKNGIQILTSGPDRREQNIRDSYFQIISSAKDYVYITTPYFIPDETILNALIVAAKSGVDVRILIPGIADKWYAYFVTLSYVEILLKEGIKLYTYNGFVHAKTFVSDDYISSVGSTNVDIRSFELDYEMNAVIYSDGIAKKLKDTFMNDISSSTELVFKEYKKRNIIIKIGEGICRLLAPIM